MRLVRTLVDEDDLDRVTAILGDENIDFLLFREAGGEADLVLVEFPVPAQAVESIMEQIRDARRGPETYTIVTSTESVFSEHAEELEDRFITGTEADDSVATEEIRARALDMTPSPQTYFSMTFLSAMVATAGLLLDSPAIVVGSMVIAPLVGSALTASVGTVLEDRLMVVEGFKTQLLGLLLAVVGATIFSFALKSAAFLPQALDVTTTQQIAQRISPGLLSLVVGLSAGAAGAFGLATGVPVALVGVMIAAALIPAAAAVGIGVAWGIPAVALGASLLLVMNVIAIHVAASAVLWYLGYRPETSPRGTEDTTALPRGWALLVTVVVLGSLFVGSAALVSTHIAFEQEVNGVVGDVLEEPRYDDLEIVAVRSEFRVNSPLTDTQGQEVTIVVARPADRRYPGLSETIATRIAIETGREVVVVLEFVDQQRYPPSELRRHTSETAEARYSWSLPASTYSVQVSRGETADPGGPRLAKVDAGFFVRPASFAGGATPVVEDGDEPRFPSPTGIAPWYRHDTRVRCHQNSYN